MAVTIIKRPQGVILNSSGDIAAATDTVGGEVIFVEGGHGLSNGDIVYIVSDVEDYNGFWYAEVASASAYFINEDLTGVRAQFVKAVNVTSYKPQLSHGWSAVHLPITYKLSSDLYPINSVDSAVNINSVQDANGYTVLQLSGSLGSVHTYDFIEITLPSDTELSGIYQIVEFISPTVILINLLYDSTNNFTSATAQKVYNNYNIVVRVYAGLNASHQWASVKPYELITTLELTPDENNETFFSINEYLKKHIETRNNLVLGTLPNNLDFMTMFYIEVAESYDDSDGYVFGTYTGPFTSDQSNFEGYAVNADLEFKNIYSGYLSEYLMTNNTAKFLTLFTIPVLFSCGDDTPDCYSDISFILPDKSVAIASYLSQEYYLNGNLGVTINDTIDEDAGVIRMPLSVNCDYERVDVTVLGGLQLLDEPSFEATGDWLQTSTAAEDWVISANQADVSLGGVFFGASSESLYQSKSGSAGNYRIIATLTTFDGGAPDNDWQVTIFVDFYSGGIGGSLVDSKTLGILSGTAVGNNPTIDYDAVTAISGSFDTIAISASLALPEVDSVIVTLHDIYIASADDELSETKQVKIDCGCAQQEIRLTWLNNLGGFDYWVFTAKAEHIVEIREVMETKKNIFPTWPKSYGADADTIRKQTSRVSNKAYTVRSQYMTQDEADAVSYIKSSVLVQIINSRTDRRTVLVDSDSFVKYQDRDKTYSISFNISFTDDIPSQTV